MKKSFIFVCVNLNDYCFLMLQNASSSVVVVAVVKDNKACVIESLQSDADLLSPKTIEEMEGVTLVEPGKRQDYEVDGKQISASVHQCDDEPVFRLRFNSTNGDLVSDLDISTVLMETGREPMVTNEEHVLAVNQNRTEGNDSVSLPNLNPTNAFEQTNVENLNSNEQTIKKEFRSEKQTGTKLSKMDGLSNLDGYKRANTESAALTQNLKEPKNDPSVLCVTSHSPLPGHSQGANNSRHVSLLETLLNAKIPDQPSGQAQSGEQQPVRQKRPYRRRSKESALPDSLLSLIPPPIQSGSESVNSLPASNLVKQKRPYNKRPKTSTVEHVNNTLTSPNTPVEGNRGLVTPAIGGTQEVRSSLVNGQESLESPRYVDNSLVRQYVDPPMAGSLECLRSPPGFVVVRSPPKVLEGSSLGAVASPNPGQAAQVKQKRPYRRRSLVTSTPTINHVILQHGEVIEQVVVYPPGVIRAPIKHVQVHPCAVVSECPAEQDTLSGESSLLRLLTSSSNDLTASQMPEQMCVGSPVRQPIGHTQVGQLGTGSPIGHAQVGPIGTGAPIGHTQVGPLGTGSPLGHTQVGPLSTGFPIGHAQVGPLDTGSPIGHKQAGRLGTGSPIGHTQVGPLGTGSPIGHTQVGNCSMEQVHIGYPAQMTGSPIKQVLVYPPGVGLSSSSQVTARVKRPYKRRSNPLVVNGESSPVIPGAHKIPTIIPAMRVTETDSMFTQSERSGIQSLVVGSDFVKTLIKQKRPYNRRSLDGTTKSSLARLDHRSSLPSSTEGSTTMHPTIIPAMRVTETDSMFTQSGISGIQSSVVGSDCVKTLIKQKRPYNRRSLDGTTKSSLARLDQRSPLPSSTEGSTTVHPNHHGGAKNVVTDNHDESVLKAVVNGTLSEGSSIMKVIAAVHATIVQSNMNHTSRSNEDTSPTVPPSNSLKILAVDDADKILKTPVVNNGSKSGSPTSAHSHAEANSVYSSVTNDRLGANCVVTKQRSKLQHAETSKLIKPEISKIVKQLELSRSVCAGQGMKEDVCYICELSSSESDIAKSGSIMNREGGAKGAFVLCQGPCCGTYHLSCLGLIVSPAGAFRCDQCSTGKYKIIRCHFGTEPPWRLFTLYFTCVSIIDCTVQCVDRASQKMACPCCCITVRRFPFLQIYSQHFLYFKIILYI